MNVNMSRERADYISIRIEEKLAQLPHTSSKCCIIRVHDQLRKANQEAYEPAIVAIGPYHRDKASLKEMEEHKLRYLQQLLERTNEPNLDRYVMAIRKMEERARKYYAEPINLVTDEFVEMMLLDGCFIVEFFCKFQSRELCDEDDPIFESDQVLVRLMRDLTLLENQLPFFVLVKLFNMPAVRSEEDTIIDLAMHFLKYAIPLNLDYPGIPIHVNHILGLVYDCLYISFVKTNRNVNLEPEWKFIKFSATELHEDFGIRFKKVERRNLFDIKFINGVLEIPPLFVSDDVEFLLRNLVAYEQCLSGNRLSYVRDYLVFMDCLINSLEDVQLLRRIGIIENQVADDAMVYTMLNKVDKHIPIPYIDFTYSEVFNKVNNHCRQGLGMAYVRRNYFKPLRKDYFNNPWAFVSFLAAVVLLLLTVTQTIFSILSVTLK